MSQTGVLPFVRGIDFTKYDFNETLKHPRLLSEMQRLRWLRANHTGMSTLPDELSTLTKLEQLHVTHNGLTSLSDELLNLSCLRVLNARYNKIKSQNVPADLSKLEDLAVLDLSFNDLNEVPNNLEEVKSILVLNLGHNAITSIPNHLFVNLTDLIYLDLSSNKLEMLPPQLRRLVHLKTLILNDNPLLHAQLRQLLALNSLEKLHLKNTQRTLSNIPQGLENLPGLVELDLSCNDLPIIPDTIYKIKTLRRLNFSQNSLTEVSNHIGDLDELITLNLSRNKLLSLPNALTKLSKLRKLYVNSNYLSFVGIPAGIGKLNELEVFSASDNRLEMLPEGLCRCGKLKKLLLNKNRLYTLPESIHFLQLQELDVSDNPDFQMPAKPIEIQKAMGAGALFYHVDFSLKHQLMLAGATPQQLSSATGFNTAPVKDPIARKKRLKLLKQNVNENESSKVLKGMRDAAKKSASTKASAIPLKSVEEALIKGKKWDEQLEKPKLDYSEFFEEDVGHIPGVTCYEIEKFLPNPIDPALNGKFYEGDCYIVLKTYIDETNSINWQIFFWIGSQATLDKQACAAMHAVNLRNLLGATCRTQREEQNDESEEFLSLFGASLAYIEGARTSSGFYTVEDIEYITRMYKVSGTQRILLQPVSLDWRALDPRFVYLLDAGMSIFLWNGLKCNPITRSKARLFAEKINKHERKFQAELIQMKQGEEVPEFWQVLKYDDGGSGEKPDIKELPENDETQSVNNSSMMAAAIDNMLATTAASVSNEILKPKLYKVGIGMGYLELPQVRANVGRLILTKELLDTKCVYILDCYSDIFVWIGRKSTRLVRTAALKLSSSLQAMIKRPVHTLVTSTLEGNEVQIFKSKFEGWDDLIAVDYTRSAEAVNKKNANFKKQQLAANGVREGSVESVSSTGSATASLNPLKQPIISNPQSSFGISSGSALPPLLQTPTEPLKTDLVALFVDRYVPCADEDALSMMEEINDFLESMECFVYENKKFVRLPENEFGRFYSEDSYLFVCKYWKVDDEPPQTPTTPSSPGAEEKDEEAEESYVENSIECKLYFWQGRDANNSGWLSFTFTLKKKFKDIEIIKFNQQQENPQFLSHFKRKFIIHKGKRSQATKEPSNEPKMYHLRKNPHSAICTRCIELDTVQAQNLCSEFCYIVSVPFDNAEENNSASSGIVYVWIGNRSDPEEAKLAEEIASYIYEDTYSIQVLSEGEEPEVFFWHALGGKKLYDTKAEYMKYMRLFRCSNDRGYFAVTEKCIDFCQDDLSDDDIMILDTGDFVYLWVGPTSTEIEVKLAFKSAQTYIQHLKLKQPNKPRKLLLTTKGKEPLPFIKCFHAWSHHKNPPRNLEKKIVLVPKERE